MEKCKMYRRGFNFSRIVKRVQTDPVPMDPKFLKKAGGIKYPSQLKSFLPVLVASPAIAFFSIEHV